MKTKVACLSGGAAALCGAIVLGPGDNQSTMEFMLKCDSGGRL